MAIVGIDIGTCYSSICVLDANGRAERLKVANGMSIFGDSYSLPSAVFAEEDGRLLLGQSAMASRMRRPENFKGEFKRDLGQLAPYQLGDRQYLPEDLYKEFFIYFKKCAEEYLHEEVDKATVTCPAAFNKNKKQLVRDAAKRSGLVDVELLDEPSAAAFGYLDTGKISEGDILLVYDLGGGTFDVALLRCTGKSFEPLTQPLGLQNCGGLDFDRLIYDHIMTSIGEETLAQVRANASFFKKFSLQVMELAVKAKHHLSGADVFSDLITVGYDAVDYTLTRKAYNDMILPIVDQTMQQVSAIVKNAGITEREVTTALLVGGCSRTPLVRDVMTRLIGKEPLKNIDPELAVCAGAAVFRKDRPQPAPAKEPDEPARQPERAQPPREKAEPEASPEDGLGQLFYQAETGKAAAQFELGNWYMEGVKVIKDPAKAIVWYRKAAAQGFVEAQVKMGECYLEGNGVPEDHVEAARWIVKAAQNGHADAQFGAGLCYKAGEGLKQDDAEAVRWFRKAAEQGHAEAQFSLGACYDDGLGIAENKKEAFNWYKKAAAEGYAEAQERLANMYMQGVGTAADQRAAVTWYEKAAENGNKDAQSALAKIYLTGEGAAKNESRGAHWCEKAAEQGDVDAQCLVAELYRQGVGVEKNLRKAASWFDKAAESGDVDAQLSFAVMLENGQGVEKDEAKADVLYQKAAEQGNAVAQNNLGVNYIMGCGVSVNYQKAQYWLDLARSNGNVTATANYGYLYEKGYGVSRDIVKAWEMYEEAASKGDATGKEKLRKLAEKSPSKADLLFCQKLMTEKYSLPPKVLAYVTQSKDADDKIDNIYSTYFRYNNGNRENEKVLIFHDYSWTDNGKTGFALTTRRILCNKILDYKAIEYSKIQSIKAVNGTIMINDNFDLPAFTFSSGDAEKVIAIILALKERYATA